MNSLFRALPNIILSLNSLLAIATVFLAVLQLFFKSGAPRVRKWALGMLVLLTLTSAWWAIRSRQLRLPGGGFGEGGLGEGPFGGGGPETRRAELVVNKNAQYTGEKLGEGHELRVVLS